MRLLVWVGPQQRQATPVSMLHIFEVDESVDWRESIDFQGSFIDKLMKIGIGIRFLDRVSLKVSRKDEARLDIPVALSIPL